MGAAGGLLDELLALIGWRREEVFITNVVKCRPPGNRDPEPDEMAACAPFLRRQLEALDPALVVTLGRFTLQTFMPGDTIGRVHGTTRPVDPATGARAAYGYAMYHPAAAFRQAALKETMQRDMAGIPEALMRARDARAGLAVPAGELAPVALSSGAVTPNSDTAATRALDKPGTPTQEVSPGLVPAQSSASPSITPADTSEPEPDMTTSTHDDQLGLF